MGDRGHEKRLTIRSTSLMLVLLMVMEMCDAQSR
jgi:hypothetical protein